MKKIQQMMSVMGCSVCLLVVSGCSLNKGEDAYKTAGSIPTLQMDGVATPQGGCGNEPAYTLNGKSYQVLASASGYREEGLASWYGAEYQGTLTAGCETFDMNAFSAAHRTLPLPSYVRVTHAQNGKSVIVRVNDRGPFEGNSLIQLSFAAANALGMTGHGNVAQVWVEALTEGEAAQQQAVVSSSPAASNVRARAQPDPEQQRAIQKAKQTGKSFYVVVSNYPDQGEALDMFIRLTSVGLSKTEMASAVENGRSVHQVRIGPLYTQDQIDNVKDALGNNGLATFRVVAVNQ